MFKPGCLNLGEYFHSPLCNFLFTSCLDEELQVHSIDELHESDTLWSLSVIHDVRSSYVGLCRCPHSPKIEKDSENEEEPIASQKMGEILAFPMGMLVFGRISGQIYVDVAKRVARRSLACG